MGLCTRPLPFFLHIYLLLLSVHWRPTAAVCKGSATFNISFEYGWTKAIDPDIPTTDPTVFVGFTKLICATHSPQYSMWQPAALATKSLATLLTQGSHASEQDLLMEIDPKTNKHIFRSDIADSVTEPTDTERLVLQVRGEGNFTLVSCVAKINPSPGWFVGLNAHPTCVDDDFVRTFEMELIGWNSGLYADSEYITDSSMENIPRDPISQLLIKAPKYGDANITDATFPGGVEPHNEAMSSCFPAGERLTLADGSLVPVERVSPGHVVQSTDQRTTSTVFMLSHADSHVVTRFLSIHFLDRDDDACSLRVSPGHYVYRIGRDGKPELVVASAVAVGDALIGADSLPRPVYKVSAVLAKGLFNPHSLDGDLIVNGVRVSSFTNAVDPNVASSALAPLRLLHRLGLQQVPNFISNNVLNGKWNTALSRLLPTRS